MWELVMHINIILYYYVHICEYDDSDGYDGYDNWKGYSLSYVHHNGDSDGYGFGFGKGNGNGNGFDIGDTNMTGHWGHGYGDGAY